MFVDMLNYSINDGLNRFVVQVINPDSTERQISEIYTLPTVDKNIITASYDKSKCKFDDVFHYLKQNSLEISDIVTEEEDLEDVFIQLTKS